jgi:hypothetical protein
MGFQQEPLLMTIFVVVRDSPVLPSQVKWASMQHVESGLAQARHGPMSHGSCLARHEPTGRAWAAAPAHQGPDPACKFFGPHSMMGGTAH